MNAKVSTLAVDQPSPDKFKGTYGRTISNSFQAEGEVQENGGGRGDIRGATCLSDKNCSKVDE